VTQIQRSFSLPIIPNAELLTNLQLVLSDAGVKNVHRHVSPPSFCASVGGLIALDLEFDVSSMAAAYLRSCGFADLVERLAEDLAAQTACEQMEDSFSPKLTH
jgi:hypothetical protein